MQQTNEFWPGWETVREIGTGSFGSVYEIARDVFGDKEQAALKVITIPQHDSDVEELQNEGYDSKSITARFQSYLENIVREYTTMSKMKGHTNVVYCDDIRYIQHEDGIGWDIYIKMELLTPLMKSLQKMTDENEVIRLGIDISNALILCKRYHIIHRDIKPQNIFLSSDGNYKLGDFGIAKTAERTQGGTKIGTYKYMAPEVYNNRPYGASVDIYSLGLVMYWLLNDRRTPFLPAPPEMPTALQEDEAKQRRFDGEPLPPPRHGSEKLKKIVLKACAYDPAERYASPDELRQALLELPQTVQGLVTAEQAEGISADSEMMGAVFEEKTESIYHPQTAETDKEIKCQNETVAAAVIAVQEEKKPISDGSSSFRTAAEPQILPNDEPTESVIYRKAREKEEKHSEVPQSRPTVSVAISAQEQQPEPDKIKPEPKAQLDQSSAAAAEKTVSSKKNRMPLLLWIGIGAAVIAAVLAVTLPILRNRTAPVGQEWSVWAEKLPADITAENYTIEERTLYRSRTLELTSSDKDSGMDGWECYDVAEGNGEFGSWTDWSEEKPEEADGREIETAVRYRSREKETTTSEKASLDGWTKDGTTYQYGNFGAWSNWQTTAVSANDTRKVETKTQYRSRTVNTTQSYSDWGSWSAWQSNRESTGDTKKEESRTAYGYYYYRCPSCGAHMAQSGTCATYAGGCGATITSANYVSFWSATSWNSAGMSSWYGSGYQYAYVDGALSFSSGNTATQYRYATRTVSTQTSYGSWSSWSDTRVTGSSSKEVQTRTVYRYCSQEKTPVYSYYRWNDWSTWSEDKVTASENREVETREVYRSRDKVYEKTYYFRRWTDWTEFSETPVTADDNTEVEAKIEYRYIPKN